MNAFITSQFSYCSLVWMFHGRTISNRINKIHEKTLKPVYKDEANLSFDDLLKKDKSISIHQRNLQILETEIYKIRNDLGLETINDIFHFERKPYNLRSDSSLQKQKSCTVYFGTETISFLAPKIWEIILARLKTQNHLILIKKK